MELDPRLILMTMADTRFDAVARKTGVRVAGEGFALGLAVRVVRVSVDLLAIDVQRVVQCAQQTTHGGRA